MLGPGNRANATIGRAIRLILKNIGGAIDGIDQATHGSPAKYSLCFAEDENAINWPSLHEDLGYEKSQLWHTLQAPNLILINFGLYFRAPSDFVSEFISDFIFEFVS